MNSPSSSDPNAEPEAQRLMLSRLIDGDADAGVAAQASAQWRSDPDMRSTWHGYQLIGDVMRSQDLASTAQHDADFLACLRTRLRQEPRVVAEIEPSRNVLVLPVSAAARPLPRWLAPAAMAAGFVAVAGVLVVTRFAAPAAEPGASTSLAAQATTPVATQSAGPGLQRAAVGATSSPSSPLASIEVMDAALVRDAQIDRYFRAHRDMRGSAAAALPGGALRSVDTIVPQR